MLLSAADADPCPANDSLGARGTPPLEPHGGVRVEVESVASAVEVEGPRETAGPSTQVTIPGVGPSHPHRVEAFERLRRPKQDRAPPSGGTGDHVQAPVDAIDQIHVKMPRSFEHRCVASRAATERVARWVVWLIGLHLDETHPGHDAVIESPGQYPTEELDRLLRRRAGGALPEAVGHELRRCRTGTGAAPSGCTAGSPPDPRPRHAARRGLRR